MKAFGYFFSGFVVGALLGFLLTQAHYEKVLDEEVEHAKEDYIRKINIARDIEERANIIDKPVNIPEKEVNTMRDIIDYNAYSSKNKEVNKLVNMKGDPSELAKLAEVREEIEEAPSEGPADRPYYISSEEFADEKEYYDKVSLTYYAGDNTVCYENGQIIDDIKGTIGREFRAHIGEYEEGVVYVRNEKLGCDYEVIEDPGYYEDEE